MGRLLLILQPAAEGEEFCTKSQLCQWTSGWNQPQTISTTDSALCRCRRCLASILIPSASRTCRKETTISSRENLTSRLLCRKTAPDMSRLCPGSSSAIFFVQHKLPLCKSLPLPLPLLKLLKLRQQRQQWSRQRLELFLMPLLRLSLPVVFYHPMTYVCKNIKITIFQQQNWRKKMILLASCC